MVRLSTGLYFSSVMSTSDDKRLAHVIKKFANLSNFVALLGGKIKSEQMISGAMADILSSIYLAESILWYHNNFATEVPVKVRDYCIERLCIEAEDKINTVINNYPNNLIKFILKPTLCDKSYRNFKKDNEIFDIILQNEHIDTLLKEHIFYENTVLEDLENLTALKRSNDKVGYKKLYQNVISVGEYKISVNDELL